MSYAIVRVKPGLGGLNVYTAPGGNMKDWRDAIEPHGVHIQTVGAPMVLKRGIDWVEVTYSRPRAKPERGWVAETCVNIDWQTSRSSVHDAQEAYRKSVSFPRSTDIPRIDLRESMPETHSPMSRRGYWLIIGCGILVACVLLAKIYLHTI